MKIVVTGAAGHVGGNLVRSLLAQDHAVDAMTYNDERALDGTGVNIVRGDVLDPRSLVRAFAGAEAVFHLVAQIALSRFDESSASHINVAGTRNVVDACLKARVGRLVHFSSVHSFCQHPKDEVIDETRPLADTVESLAYDRSKALADREVMRAIQEGLDAVIVHPAGIVGPHDYKPSNFGQALLQLGRCQIPALVPGSYNFVDVRDVVDGAIAALHEGRPGERYILSGHEITVEQLGSTVQALTGRPAPRFTVPMVVARMAAPFAETFARITGRRALFTRGALETLCQNCKFDYSKATDELGFTPRPLNESLSDTFDWFRSVEWIN